MSSIFLCVYVYRSLSGRLRIEYLCESRESSDRLRSILAIPEAEREWSELLSESSLRQSSLWRFVGNIPEGITTLQSPDNPRLVFIKRSLEVLGYTPNLLTELTTSERLFADLAMSRPFTLPLSGSNALERLRQAKKSSVGSSDVDREAAAAPADIPVSTRNQARRKKKRVAQDGSSALLSDTVALSFPSNAAAYSEIGPHLGEIDKLLWPEDDLRMEQVGVDGSVDATVSHLFQVQMFCLVLFALISGFSMFLYSCLVFHVSGLAGGHLVKEANQVPHDYSERSEGSAK